MRSLVLRLEGPLQSWATQSKLGIRDTDREPSKSGVIGLIGAALGMDRDDDVQLAELRALSMAVRVDRAGALLRDYHTVGGGRFRDRSERGDLRYFVFDTDAGKVGSNCIPTERYYLQDASFTVALSGESGLMERIAGAVRMPHWPIFLGRRACVPSAPVFLDLVDIDAPTAIRAAPISMSIRPDMSERLRLIVEASPDDGGEPRYDDPLSFRVGRKRYGIRYVKTEWMDVPDTIPASAEVRA